MGGRDERLINLMIDVTKFYSLLKCKYKNSSHLEVLLPPWLCFYQTAYYLVSVLNPVNPYELSKKDRGTSFH